VKALLIGAFAGWLSGCAIMPTRGPIPVGEATLYVVERGWHTDIGLSVEEVSRPLASLEEGFPGMRFMVFGFGERAYYMGQNSGSAEMLTALLPSESAILMTALNASPIEAFADHKVIILRLPPDDLARVASRLWDDLEKTADGRARRLADGPYVGSVFFASNETYDAFHTCNTWTALLLREAGFPVDPHVLFADQVMRQVRVIATRQATER
jgi:hypothetical protein